MRPGFSLGNASDVGREREVNEDYFGYAEPDSDTLFRRKGRLLIVSDGMGGAAGGDVASRMVVETVRTVYESSEATDPREALSSAIEEANRRVFERANEDPNLRGMGATCTAVAIIGNTAYVAHVGDTRAYLVRAGSALQLTDDQSLVARMVREGVITPEEAIGHPKSNVIEQAVGQKAAVRVDVSVPPQPLDPGDILVLCTDGLHGVVPPHDIARVVGAYAPSDAAKVLIDMANGRGGPDNITVQIARIGLAGRAPGVAAGGDALKPGWHVLPIVGLASLVLAAVVGGLAVHVWSRGRGSVDRRDGQAGSDAATMLVPDAPCPDCPSCAPTTTCPECSNCDSCCAGGGSDEAGAPASDGADAGVSAPDAVEAGDSTQEDVTAPDPPARPTYQSPTHVSPPARPGATHNGTAPRTSPNPPTEPDPTEPPPGGSPPPGTTQPERPSSPPEEPPASDPGAGSG